MDETRTEEKMESGGEHLTLYDKKGTKYIVVRGTEEGTIILKSEFEIKGVPSSKLSNYSMYPPEVHQAMEGLCELLKSGEITMEDIRRMKKRTTGDEALRKSFSP